MDRPKVTRTLVAVLLFSSVVTICFVPALSGQQFTTSFSLTDLTTVTAPVTFHLFTGFCYFAFFAEFNTTGSFDVYYSFNPDFVTMTLYVLDTRSYSAWQNAFASGLSASLAPNRCVPANYALAPPYERDISGGGTLHVTLTPFALTNYGSTYGIVLTDVDLSSGPPAASISVGPVQP